MFETFLFDQQWCMLHYPEKPNGFAIFIIGDQQHYVNEDTSFWVDNKGRAKMIERLTNAGYLVYYSNLFGKNWGNQQSVEHAFSLYQILMRREILNKKIHIFAEGMGSLTASQLIPIMKENIRSIVLFAPCILLDKHIEQEKSRKFYYSKLKKEIYKSFHDEEPKIQSTAAFEEMTQPMFIIQVIDQNLYKDQMEIINDILQKRKESSLGIEIHYILLEHRQYITEKILRFFKENEKVL